MFFASPIWLFGLIPWTALAVWMLWGRRPAAVVPFIDLWRGPVSGKYVERSVHPPPRAIVMILLAALLALLAASSPTVRGKGGPRVTIVVDRGITMSAIGRARPRFVETSEDAAAGLRETLEQSRLTADEVRVVVVPNGGPHTTRLDDWTSLVSHLPATAFDTRDAVTAAVARERSQSDLLLVVTDHHAVSNDEGVVQVQPTVAPTNAGITLVAARATPAAQLIIRLRNDSPMATAKLVVTTAGQAIERDVQLPARGGEADQFVDLSKVDDVIHARLDTNDALAADNEAWLVRERAWPVVEARVATSPALSKMIEVYSRTRKAGGGAPLVAIVDEEKALAPGEAGVVVTATNLAKPQAAEPVVVDHPVTRNVAWANVLKEAMVAPPPPQGWTPLVSLGGNAVVAVREGDARRVWVGFDSDSFARSTDYVVFWTNVFDWLGRGGETFAAHPMTSLGDEWELVTPAAGAPAQTKGWPGLYRRQGDGALRAVNAPAPRIGAPVETDWRALLRRAAEARAAAGGLRLAPWIVIAAVACLLAAGWWWPGRGLTRFSGRRTV